MPTRYTSHLPTRTGTRRLTEAPQGYDEDSDQSNEVQKPPPKSTKRQKTTTKATSTRTKTIKSNTPVKLSPSQPQQPPMTPYQSTSKILHANESPKTPFHVTQMFTTQEKEVIKPLYDPEGLDLSELCAFKVDSAAYNSYLYTGKMKIPKHSNIAREDYASSVGASAGKNIRVHMRRTMDDNGNNNKKNTKLTFNLDSEYDDDNDESNDDAEEENYPINSKSKRGTTTTKQSQTKSQSQQQVSQPSKNRRLTRTSTVNNNTVTVNTRGNKRNNNNNDDVDWEFSFDSDYSNDEYESDVSDETYQPSLLSGQTDITTQTDDELSFDDSDDEDDEEPSSTEELNTTTKRPRNGKQTTTTTTSKKPTTTSKKQQQQQQQQQQQPTTTTKKQTKPTSKSQTQPTKPKTPHNSNTKPQQLLTTPHRMVPVPPTSNSNTIQQEPQFTMVDIVVKYPLFGSMADWEDSFQTCQEEVVLYRQIQTWKCPFLLRYYGTHGPGLVFEYVDGESLDSLLFHVSDVDIESQTWLWSELGMHITSALFYLHKLNISHNDIKPENVRYSASKKIWKLLDLGLATDFDMKVSKQIGTSGYRSPEVEKTGRLNRKSDIFGLGVMMDDALEKIIQRYQILEDIYDDFEDIRREAEEEKKNKSYTLKGGEIDLEHEMIEVLQQRIKRRKMDSIPITLELAKQCIQQCAVYVKFLENARELIKSMLENDYENRPSVKRCLFIFKNIIPHETKLLTTLSLLRSMGIF